MPKTSIIIIILIFTKELLALLGNHHDLPKNFVIRYFPKSNQGNIKCVQENSSQTIFGTPIVLFSYT